MPHPFSIWKRVLHVAHRAGFTKNEAGVIVFLAAALLAGGAIEMLRGSETADAPSHGAADIREALAAQDSVFAARSASPETASASISDSGTTPLSTDAAALRDPKQPSARIDINRATETELLRLPGVGPATAEKIVAYRGEHGRFERIEDVMLVKSIGPKKFEKLRQFITVE